ncbi:MAG: Fe-S cluster assembly transcriptional regulator IscR [Rickettsia endosymbiont of Sergentomyia squamirostris]|uniref:Fe-S cluster assembly transcriptional regulator IscR n=1 Tax=Candidatus Tisiphia endosymbiont of Sergentomyia squamirostris TaxID=3113639 RepID=A0AAT9G6K9_9RICK
MQLTTKGRYAVMAILEIASQMSDIPVTLAEISAKQNVPVNYLEQIFAKLKKANIVRSAKGPKGGYIINEKLNNIKITNIIDAVDENIEMTRCLGKSQNSCVPNKVKCNAHHLWLGLSKHIRNYFDTISVADMLADTLD